MKVIQMTTKAFWKGEMGVKGIVEEGGTKYCPSLSLKGGEVMDYGCTCPEGLSYKGMCVHCQALYGHFKEKQAAGSSKPVITSQAARTMVREYTNREVAQLVREEEVKQVLLVPILVLGRQEVKLEFKLGRDRLYKLGDLVAFSKALAEGAYVEYGKSLAFHHHLQAFSPACQPLVGLVAELAGAYREHYGQFQKSSPASIPPLPRLNLMPSNRDRFFHMMENHVLEVEDARGQRRRLAVTVKNPQLQVSVKKEGGDGVRVSVDPGIMAFFGERHLYLVHGPCLYQCDEKCSATLQVFIEQMVQAYGATHEVLVSHKDLPLFYERVLKKIAPYVEIDAQVDLEAFKPQELKARFDFDSQGANQMTMRPTLSYGDFSFQPIEDEKVPRTICRDVPGEFKVSRLIMKYFQYKENGTDSLVIQEDQDAIYRLLTQGMDEFAAMGQVYLSEAFRHFKVMPPPQVSVSVENVGGWLKLAVDTQGMSGQELAKVLAGYSQKKKYHRLKTGEFLTLDDGGLVTLARLVDRLGVSKADLAGKEFSLPRYRALYLDGILKEGRGLSLYRDALFKAVVRGMKSVEDSDFQAPQPISQVLRPYQKLGFRWLRTLDAYGFGGILADDMGLGKTIQVIALILDEAMANPGQPSLIICPASLVYNWENEIRTFAPSLKVQTVTGLAQERQERLEGWKDWDVLVTSYDLLKRDLFNYQGKKFRFQVIDEAQFIKNAKTQSAKAVKGIQAATKLALTGTPIENRLGELWSIFDYLMPGFLFSSQKFKKEYEVPILKDKDQEALESLHRIIGPFILRRLKKDVLKELPDKLETVVYSKFEKEQGELYHANAYQLKKKLEEGAGGGADQLGILAELTRLRQICCDPRLCYENYSGRSAKLETCLDLVKNGASGGHKILLFSQFASMLDLVGKSLQKEGLAYHLLTGATPKEKRLHMVGSFQDDQVPVFLISLKAGGTGLNLTAADLVIHYDPWWNVAAQNQATDRSHRIGQDKQVSVFRLITKGTIEENILKLQELKKDLAEQVITEGTLSFGSLTKEELLGLLE